MDPSEQKDANGGTEGTHPSDLELETGGPEFDAHVASCDHCRARVHGADHIGAMLDNVVLPATVAPVRAARFRMRLRRRPPAWLLVGGPAALTVAVGIVLMLAIGSSSRQPTDSTDIGAQGIRGPKGLPLEIVVKRGGSVFRLSDGQALRPGDGLRFVYRGDTSYHATLWTRDRGGRLVRFFPEGSTSALINPGDTLPGATVIDAVPGREHIELWMSAAPFRATETGAPPARVTIYPIDLRKEP